jgi:cation diffusion facilitator family transporter
VFVVVVERREGKRLQSELLLADAAHTSSDVYATLLVFASFGAARLHIAFADVVAATLILGLILHAGFRIVKGTLSTLSDERRIAPEQIEAAALEDPEVLEAHNVRSRGPDDDIHLDLHILVDPRMPIAEAHAVGHRVERRLRANWPGLTDVVVHVEPGLESERARVREGGGLKAEG